MRELVLVGGGHAHVQVLRGLAMRPAPDLRVTVVLDRPVAVYSGMVPGFVAGDYAREELEIDVRPLARRAGARVVVAAATGVDPVARRIELEDRPPLAYELASLDVGSGIAGAELPGVREHALPTRPIGDFVAQLDARVDARVARLSDSARLVVVGAGAGGIELAFALRARLPGAQVRLLEARERLLPEAAPRLAALVEARARELGIELRSGARVEAVEEKAVHLAGDERLDADAVVWVGGAAPPPLLRDTPLPTDPAGFVRVDASLQVEGHPGLFAAGDCASLAGSALPKAGVYAVRAGPVLAHNLRAGARGARLRRWRPQRDFLTLLNTGDGRAIGAKWGRALEGAWLFRLKDAIDRRFVRRFQVLGADDAPRPELPAMEGDDGEMRCGGCAAKVGAAALGRALERLGAGADPDVVIGLAAADDAAAVRSPAGELVVSSLDAFPAFTEDAWLVGRVAAVNAASDLWVEGVAPRFALAQVQVPEAERERADEVLYQVLAGARRGLEAEGTALVGGHSSLGETLQVGFAVWGFAGEDAPLLRSAGLRVGDRLILGKPLGTGLVFAADARGEARGPWVEAALASMLRSNAEAARIAVGAGARGATDVSGFGLAGHLASMLRASRVSARVFLDAVPLLPGAASLLDRGVRSTLHPDNRAGWSEVAVEPALHGSARVDALADPQTSGGLLVGVAPEREGEVIAALRAAGYAEAAVVGEVLPADADGPRLHLRAGAGPDGPPPTAHR